MRYYPSINDFERIDRRQAKQELTVKDKLSRIFRNNRANELQVYLDKQGIKNYGGVFAPGHIIADDGLPVDQTLRDLTAQIIQTTDSEDKRNLINLRSRMTSVSHLTISLYQEFLANPNTMSNWFPELQAAWKCTDQWFNIPKTKIITLQPDLAEYFRWEYQDIPSVARDKVNEIIFQAFDLDPQQEYFIKTGTFSSKFEFKNAHLTESKEIADYFVVINNFAMTVGAGTSVDLVVREWIDDPENHDTIYDGMPLRTEFRVFINCDEDTVIGVVPYWNPLVMKNVLQTQGKHNPEIQRDYETYKANEERLNTEFNECQHAVSNHVAELLPHLDLHGKYSLDVMKSGDKFYLIDMATMEDSALKELLHGTTD